MSEFKRRETPIATSRFRPTRFGLDSDRVPTRLGRTLGASSSRSRLSQRRPAATCPAQALRLHRHYRCRRDFPSHSSRCRLGRRFRSCSFRSHKRWGVEAERSVPRIRYRMDHTSSMAAPVPILAPLDGSAMQTGTGVEDSRRLYPSRAEQVLQTLRPAALTTTSPAAELPPRDSHNAFVQSSCHL